MSSFSSVTVVGQVGRRGVEVKHSSGGTAFAKFTVVTTDAKKNGNKWEYHNNYLDVVCFGDTATRAGDYLKPDSTVIINGSLKQETWEKDGVKQYAIKIHASTVKEVKLKESREQEDKSSKSRDRKTDLYDDDEDFF